MVREIAVSFPGYPPLYYWAEEIAAETLADKLEGRVKVTFVELRCAVKRLPCERLWLP